MDLKTKLIVPSLIVLCLISGCSPRARYESRLKHELARGVRCDSIFMGLYLGMPQKDFYTQCWKLNRKGLIKQGETNSTVLYNTRDELKYPATMDFYPTFKNGKIATMPVKFAYTGWAPWNKELLSEKLEENVLRWYRKVYGGGFIKVKDPTRGTAWVKIDGNRRISIFKENDDLHVWALFTDLLAPADSLRTPGQVPDSLKKTVEIPVKK
jgi:hypothetical protein